MPSPGAGALFLVEIHEQPAALARLASRAADLEAVAAAIRRLGRPLIRIIGHGSSDNAASFGVYSFGLIAGLTALRDSISLPVYYGAEIDLRGSCVLALSQSGRTPDVVEYVRRAVTQGAYAVAITNEVDSPLAEVADAVLPLSVGAERALAATKTYTAQIATLALLPAYVAGQGELYSEGLIATAETLRAWLPDVGATLTLLASQLCYTGRMLIVARGPEFATARELALKLLETCRIAAQPLTATELAHGPVAALDPLFPVWAIAGADAGLQTVVEAVARARAAGATVIVSGEAASSLAGAATIPVPRAALPLLAPVLSIVPGQLLASALARAKGLDPDRPAGLAKITVVP